VSHLLLDQMSVKLCTVLGWAPSQKWDYVPSTSLHILWALQSGLIITFSLFLPSWPLPSFYYHFIQTHIHMYVGVHTRSKSITMKTRLYSHCCTMKYVFYFISSK
jgi:hypothetical protein